MRSEQALRNMIANIILQVTVFLSGIILPRFFLEAYGSSINGMVTSANQFLTYLSLAEAGVGTAAVVALYGPLADKNNDKINSVLSAARQYYCRSGCLFLGMVLGLVGIYPYLITQQLSAGLVRGMLLVLAGSTVIDFFLLGKYRILLTANQKSYVSAIIEAIGTLLNAVITIGLIHFRFNVVLVKSVGILIFVIRYLITRWYVRKEYPYINFKVPSVGYVLKQRGAALLHQVVGIIVNNTDVVLLTILLGEKSLLEVSVYGIYYMVVSAINMLLNSFSNGLTAGFGEVISQGEQDTLKTSFSGFEYLYYIVLFTVCVCIGILLLPFVSAYTIHMTDAEYMRPGIAILFTMIVFLQNVRIPGLTIVCAAGHFKETQNQAVLEAVINLIVSLLLIRPLGLAGVLIGTVCSYAYRSTATMHYNSIKLIFGSWKNTVLRNVRNIIVSIILIVLGMRLVPRQMDSLVQWFVYACGTGILSLTIILLFNYFCEPQSFRELSNRVKQIVRNKIGKDV